MGEKIITLLGPTASGKTRVAARLAYDINAEIISADSRQVYKNMTIGTGKDLSEYSIDNIKIPYHLIDILEAGKKYNLARFQKDFKRAVLEIQAKDKLVILCGGTGLYIQGVVENFKNTAVPENLNIRNKYLNTSNEDLNELLSFHNEKFDTRKRAIRKLEIIEYKTKNIIGNDPSSTEFEFDVFGLNPSRDLRRNRISQRLKVRLENEGLIEEVDDLLNAGITHEQLEYYGLEYKYISYYLKGDLNYTQLFTSLETAIHRFAKRQMTFFRSMEKKGIQIHWLDDELSTEEQISYIKEKAGLTGPF